MSKFKRTSSNYYSNRAHSYILLENYEKVLENYNSAIELDDSRTISFINRGNINVILEDYQAALSDYQTALKLANDYQDRQFILRQIRGAERLIRKDEESK